MWGEERALARDTCAVLSTAQHTQVLPLRPCFWTSISRGRLSSLSVHKFWRTFRRLSRPESHWPGVQCARTQSVLGMPSSIPPVPGVWGMTPSNFSPLKPQCNRDLPGKVWLDHSARLHIVTNLLYLFLSTYLKVTFLLVYLLGFGMCSSLEFSSQRVRACLSCSLIIPRLREAWVYERYTLTIHGMSGLIWQI